MSIISQLYQVPCKLQDLHLPSKSSLLFANSFKLLSLSSASLPLLSLSRAGTKREYKVKSMALHDEWGPDYKGRAVSIAGPPSVEDRLVVETNGLKRQLVESFYGTASGDQNRAKIVELITKLEDRAKTFELITRLEAKNPHPAPAEALPLFDGKWILVYTSFLGLFPLLSRRTPPLITAEEMSETINSENFTARHSIRFSSPLVPASITVSTKSNFEFGTPSRVQVKFEEFIIGPPEPNDSIGLPENVEFLGSPFKDLIDSLHNIASLVATTVSSQPSLKFNIPEIEVWLVVTYLDGELRIGRSDVGSVFVFLKESSPLLSP